MVRCGNLRTAAVRISTKESSLMKSDTEIVSMKRAAAERARTLGLAYSGALLPAEAYHLMQSGTTLVDVRTRAELDWVGRVPGALWIEWNGYPGAQLNPDFLAQLGELVDKDDAIMFICRSGARSHHAAHAATQAGWLECYNVLEGFEGDKDASQHRGALGGWRKAGLPWVQS
jgi:rhodanese-related sulfurtransferase